MNSIAGQPILVLGGTGKTGPPGRRAAHGTRAAGPHRLARRPEPAFDWEDRADVGARAATASRRSTSPTSPTRGARRASRRSARSPSSPSERRRAPGAAVRPRRGRGASGPSRPSATRAPSWTIAALQLVHAELQRGLLPRSRARRRGRAAGRRRGRSRSSTPTTSPTSRSPRSPTTGTRAALRAHRAPAAHLRRGAAEIAAEATGREIEYVPISTRGTSPPSSPNGACPAEVVELLSYLFSEVLDGRNAHIADGVRSGRSVASARDFADYARAAAASGVWNPAPVTA